MQAYHFFRPLLSPAHGWTSFRWHKRPATDDLTAATSIAAACSPLARLFPLFVPCLPAWLETDGFRQLQRSFGGATVIPCLPAAAMEQPAVLDACQRLRGEGAHVALEIDTPERLRTAPAVGFDHLLLDAEYARRSVPLIDLINAHQQGFVLVAETTGTHELFDWACAKRFSLCSGEFIVQPNPNQPTDADTARLKLLKLLSLVVQDADTRSIEEIFRQEPKLSYNLLRLVNSVAVGPKTPITGFNQAITVLGRRQLQRWLQLLIYANQFTHGNQPNPLLQLAAARGRQMELLASTQPVDPELTDAGEAAFMIGIFSLLDTLLRMPMSEILAALPVAPAIAAALSEREGPLGRLLSAICNADSGDFDTAAALLDGMGISPLDHVEAQVAAYSWACRINLE